MKRIENYDVLLALRPISGGQLVALSGLRQVSSEKEESISASDKCWDQDLRRGTANVQNNTVAPTSEEGSWYILWIVVVPANWNIMSERQIYHTYFTDCWLETGGGPCMCIPFLFYSLWSHLLPWFLFSLVSSCLFRRGGGRQQQHSLKAFSLNAGQRQCHLAFVRVCCLPCCVASATSVHPVACVMTAPNPAGFGLCRHGGKRGLLPRKPESTVKRGNSPEKDPPSSKYPSFFSALSPHLTIHSSLPRSFSLSLSLSHTF